MLAITRNQHSQNAPHLPPQRRELAPQVRLPRLSQRALAPRAKQLLTERPDLGHRAARRSERAALPPPNEVEFCGIGVQCWCIN